MKMKKLLIAVTLICSAIILVGAQTGFAYTDWTNGGTGGCKTCHPQGTFGTATPPQLHGISAHIANCANCHAGGIPIVGNVSPSACIVCHPPADPGLCPLINESRAGAAHGQSCLACHTECAPVTTTTTTVPPVTTTVPQTTTTTPPAGEIEVSIDIKPGSCPNPIGNGDNNGVMPFAIMGTTDFDITQIDPESIRITREGVDDEVAPIRWSYEDVATPFEGELCDCHCLKGDGIMDLSMKVYREDLVDILDLQELAGQTVELTITGNLLDEFGGTPIVGEDCVKVLKSVSKEKKEKNK
jgi:hypothetical protein